MSIEFLQRKLSRRPIAFIHDRGGDRGFKLLRSLPAIHYLGTDRFTFPKSWRQLQSPAQYDYLEYEYELLGETGPPETNLCAITNQNYEDHTEFTISPLIAEYEQNQHDATLVVVGDREDFEPQGGQRPLAENEFVSDFPSYHAIFQWFEESYEDAGLSCPLGDTENLFMQDNANIYRMVTGEQLRHTQELFNVLPEAPYLPLYRGLASIFSRRSEPGSSPLDSFEAIEGLGKWLRRRIEWDRQLALSVAKELNEVVAQNGRVFDTVQPRRHPSADAARECVSERRSESPIHARYAEWVANLTK